MGTTRNIGIEKMATRVTALVVSRLRGRGIADELSRIEAAPVWRARLEIASVILGLFCLAIVAAGFGWVGLACFFAAVLIIFR